MVGTFTVYHNILCLDNSILLSSFCQSSSSSSFSFLLFFGLEISCSEESIDALKPAKYSSSTSSIVLALLLLFVRLYNFFVVLATGYTVLQEVLTCMHISIQTLLWS